MNQNSKVLIFDSGMGGLSVYQAIARQYPQLNFVYLFDNEGYPYGELEQAVLIDRTTRLIGKIVPEQDIDLVVIACNTASTIVLPALRELLDIPVVGVVPAIKPAAAIAKKALGLIATPATVKRQYTHDLIEQFSPNLDVNLLGSTELVLMAEQKMRGESIDLDQLAKILAPLVGQIDVAILGCTHFPLLKDEIQQIFGEKVTLVDSGEAIANRVGHLLGLKELLELKECTLDDDMNSQCPFAIYSSATPEKEVALNKALQNFGFNPVDLFPLQDV